MVERVRGQFCSVVTEFVSAVVFKIFDPTYMYLGHDLDLSRQRDAIGNVTSGFATCLRLFDTFCGR